MQFHPIANIFPMMTDSEIADLAEDIKAHGLIEAIWTYQGQIVDGRNRYRACLLAGEEPRYQEWNGAGSLVGFVVSLNLKRRHLNESQRGMVAANIANIEPHNLGNSQKDSELGSIDPSVVKQSEAAQMLNVSLPTVKRAAVVKTHGVPELQAAVTAGTLAVSPAAEIAWLPDTEQREVIAYGEKEILQKAKEIRAAKTETRRTERIAKIAGIAVGNAPLVTVTGQFSVVYADPPWRYEHSESESRAIENQYPTMTLDEICDLPLLDITTPDCVLYLWATSPKLAEAMRVIEAWGFTYRTCAVWVKDKIGMGYYFRQQHELLLVAARGNVPPPPPALRQSSVINAPRLEHSAKPESVAELIELWYPTLAKVELFARAPRAGWGVWGNQA